jgi:hypothetical protein
MTIVHGAGISHLLNLSAKVTVSANPTEACSKIRNPWHKRSYVVGVG